MSAINRTMDQCFCDTIRSVSIREELSLLKKGLTADWACSLANCNCFISGFTGIDDLFPCSHHFPCSFPLPVKVRLEFKMKKIVQMFYLFGIILERFNNGLYYYHVFMILIESRITLNKLLTIKISDLDSEIFKMRYNRVRNSHFLYLKSYSRKKGSSFLLAQRSRNTYVKFLEKANKLAETNIRIRDFRIEKFRKMNKNLKDLN